MRWFLLPCRLAFGSAGSLCIGLTLVFVVPAATQAQADRVVSDVPATEPQPERFKPKQPRSEAESDRVAAAAWYTQARLLQHSGEKSQALRAYERAWRCDPAATTILAEIVSLAFELKRNDEAARYAVLAAEHNPTDAILVRRLALYLADERKWERAVRLYERSLELQPAMQEVTDLGSAILHQEMGRLYFLSDEYQKSAASFAKVRDALQASPGVLDEQSQEIVLGDDAHDTYALWAESFLAAERFDEALVLFAKANAGQSQQAAYALQRARVGAARGEAKKAIDHLHEHFASGVADSTLEPYSLLEQLLKKVHTNSEQAQAQLIHKLEEIRQTRLEDPALAYFLAERLRQAGRLDEAVELLTATLAKQPASEGYRQLVSIYRERREVAKLARTLADVAKTTGSLRSVEEEAAAIAGDAALLVELLKFTRRQLADKPAEIADRQLFVLGLLAAEAQHWDAAEEMFEADIKANPQTKNDVLLTWGFALYLADQYKRTIPVFRRAIAEGAGGENSAAVHLSLAGALELDGQTDEALQAAAQAVAANPRSAATAARVGWILYHAKRYDEAAKTYRDLIARHDEQHDSTALRETMRDAKLALSSVLLAQDQFDAAVEQLEQVLDEYPEDAGALNDLGYLWAERGLHLKRSLAMTQKAVSAEPANASFRDSLGWTYYQLGRYAEAVRELEIAAGGKDPDGVVLEHLGDAYAKANERAKARTTWERALQAFQASQETERLEALRHKVAQFKP